MATSWGRGRSPFLFADTDTGSPLPTGSCAEPREGVSATKQDRAWWQKGDTFPSCPKFLFLAG